jgi:transcriptional regulator
MYVPPAFAEDRPEVLARIIDEHGFATLVTTGASGLIASHVPLLHDPARGVLIGHVARPNPQAADLKSGAEALAIFTGPHGYISPRWYADQQAVPTWNYAAVHAYGRVRRIEDGAELAGIVSALAAKYEAGAPEPWRYEDLPPQLAHGKLRGIVGFELTITRLEGKLKLSQNREPADRAGVIEALSASPNPGDAALAALMREQEALSSTS